METHNLGHLGLRFSRCTLDTRDVHPKIRLPISFDYESATLILHIYAATISVNLFCGQPLKYWGGESEVEIVDLEECLKKLLLTYYRRNTVWKYGVQKIMDLLPLDGANGDPREYLEKLAAHLTYLPGGPGAEAAAEHFQSLI